jgi:hypothetical protein
MRQRSIWITAFLISTITSVTLPLHAGKQPGSKTPVIVTFRDCLNGVPSPAFLTIQPAADCPVTVTADRIASDFGHPYVDGENDVEAFLGTQANSGNVLLNVKRSSRGMLLDFTECESVGSCKPPLTQVYSLSSIRIDATAVRKNGLLGMAVGETMNVPARVEYKYSPEQGPGFIDFDPKLGGRNPCKGASNYVSATRTGEQTWDIVSESRIGCVTLPDTGGMGWGGNYRFPYHFTVQIK